MKRRLGAAVIAAALLLTMVHLSPAHGSVTPALAPSDPLATTVTAPCGGGPGMASLSVSPKDQDGRYPVRLEANGLPDGSVWRISFEEGDRVRRTAEGGSWSVETALEGAEGSLFAYAQQLQPDGRGFCLLIVSPSRPAAGASSCGRGLEVLVARELDDGSTVVRFLLAWLKPETLWNLDLRVRTKSGTEDISFQSFTNRRGTLRTRVQLDAPLTDPVFRMRAVSENGLRCAIKLDPGKLVPGAEAPLSRLLREGAAARLAR